MHGLSKMAVFFAVSFQYINCFSITVLGKYVGVQAPSRFFVFFVLFRFVTRDLRLVYGPRWRTIF